MAVAAPSPPSGTYLTGPMLLLEEISHRVLNEYTCAIASIHLAAAKMAPHESSARTVLAATAERLRAQADVHKALRAPSAQEVRLDEYLSSICKAITLAVLAERGIRLVLKAVPISLDADRCWRIALIVSELITNAVRHGLNRHGGLITVELEMWHGLVACVVIDNGKAVSQPRPARGSKVLKALIAEIGGQIAWDFKQLGTQVSLTLPYAAAREADPDGSACCPESTISWRSGCPPNMPSSLP